MSPRNYLNLKGEKMPVKLKSFSTVDYYHICGMHLKRFAAGVKGNVKIDYHHPHGVMVYRDEKTPEFVPIHNIKIITPENIEDLQEALGVAPATDGPIRGTLPENIPALPRKKRTRRTKAEMEAARAAVS